MSDENVFNPELAQIRDEVLRGLWRFARFTLRTGCIPGEPAATRIKVLRGPLRPSTTAADVFLRATGDLLDEIAEALEKPTFEEREKALELIGQRRGWT